MIFFTSFVVYLILSLLIVFFVLIAVAFLTLLEQKVLSYIQLRKGPNKVGFIGLLQPFSDAVKLFTKEYMVPSYSNYLVYYLSPLFVLFLSLTIWMCFPFLMKFLSFDLGFLFMLSCLSMGVYPVMVAGWSSNSNYSLLGGLRSIAQTISYEVCLILLLLSYLVLVLSFNLLELFKVQVFIDLFWINLPVSFVLMIVFLAETNRSPFDFAEGESELVSGFNVEYSSGGFAMIFLAEYSSILFMSGLFCILLLGGNIFSFLFFLKVVFISFIYIWVRGSFPRHRYDLFMYLTWKSYLIISLNYLLIFVGVKLYLLSFILINY